MASKELKVAAVQAEPVWNDLQGGVAKTISLIKEASANGANVVGFPEAFIPGYPCTFITPFIDETGVIVHHRRKIKPTHVERAYWGDGQADSLKAVVSSSIGNIGGLNCWKHTQPLLRYHQYSQNVDVQVASWPLCWDPMEGQPWPFHLTPPACNKFSQVMAMEGACFVMVCSQVLTEEGKAKTRLSGFDYARCPGGGFSMIYGPDGSELCKPLDPGAEGLLYAEVDLAFRAMAQQNLDVVGHYSRPDLLSLQVTKEATLPVRYK